MWLCFVHALPVRTRRRAGLACLAQADFATTVAWLRPGWSVRRIKSNMNLHRNSAGGPAYGSWMLARCTRGTTTLIHVPSLAQLESFEGFCSMQKWFCSSVNVRSLERPSLSIEVFMCCVPIRISWMATPVPNAKAPRAPAFSSNSTRSSCESNCLKPSTAWAPPECFLKASLGLGCEKG